MPRPTRQRSSGVLPAIESIPCLSTRGGTGREYGVAAFATASVVVAPSLLLPANTISEVPRARARGGAGRVADGRAQGDHASIFVWPYMHACFCSRRFPTSPHECLVFLLLFFDVSGAT